MGKPMTCTTLPPSAETDSRQSDIPAGRFAVVAHDAGAANQIFSWLSAGDLDPDQAIFALAGPAQTLAHQFGFDGTNYSVEHAVFESGWVLTGTGWQTDHEKSAMSAARRYGKKCVAVLDHWVNYRPRFNLCDEGSTEVDELWVVDTEAARIAEEEFPGAEIRRMPGRYLERQIAEVKSAPHRGRILFLMEPVRDSWGMVGVGEAGEFAAFRFFLQCLEDSSAAVGDITIRPHPSDPENKYTSLTDHQIYKITVDSTRSLSSALSDADCVVGLNSYAMVVALAAGRKVYCALPPEAPACVLPHAGIMDLRSVSFRV